MEQPNGNPCPECGAPRNPDNTPSCACTTRASDALRDARTAEAAAAEDFDPLRIRPYVELDGETARSTPDGSSEAADAGDTAEGSTEAPGRPAESVPRPAPAADGSGTSGAADETMPLRAVTPEDYAATLRRSVPLRAQLPSGPDHRPRSGSTAPP